MKTKRKKLKITTKKSLRVRGGFGVAGGGSRPITPFSPSRGSLKSASSVSVFLSGARRLMQKHKLKEKALDMAADYLSDTLNRKLFKVGGAEYRTIDLSTQAPFINGDSTQMTSTHSEKPSVVFASGQRVGKRFRTQVNIGKRGLSPYIFSKSDPVEEIVQVDTQMETAFAAVPNADSGVWNTNLIDRNTLNPEWGFNQKLIHFMRADEIPTIRRPMSDLGFPVSLSTQQWLQTADNDAKYTLKMSKCQSHYKFTNVGFGSNAKIRVTLFTLDDTEIANSTQWLMDNCWRVSQTSGSFRFPANYLITPTTGSIGTNPVRYSGHVFVDPVVTFKKVPYLREKGTIIAQASKLLGPNDIWDLNVNCFFKNGLDLVSMNSAYITSWAATNSTPPGFAVPGTAGNVAFAYNMMVECWGEQVEGTVFNGSIPNSQRSSVIGTAPGCISRETKITYTFHNDDISRQAALLADYEPFKLVAEGPSLRYGVNVKKRRFAPLPNQIKFNVPTNLIGTTGQSGKLLSIRTAEDSSVSAFVNAEGETNP